MIKHIRNQLLEFTILIQQGFVQPLSNSNFPVYKISFTGIADKPLDGPDAEINFQTNPPAAPLVPTPPNAVRLQLDPPNYKKSSSIPQAVASLSPKLQTVISSLYVYPSRNKSYKISSAIPQLFAQIALNRDAMVSYTYTYVFNHNTDYRDYSGNGGGGDCTNFVSQILRAGGWSDVNGGDYTND